MGQIIYSKRQDIYKLSLATSWLNKFKNTQLIPYEFFKINFFFKIYANMFIAL